MPSRDIGASEVTRLHRESARCRLASAIASVRIVFIRPSGLKGLLSQVGRYCTIAVVSQTPKQGLRLSDPRHLGRQPKAFERAGEDAARFGGTARLAT
jgi:hypothetical protein